MLMAWVLDGNERKPRNLNSLAKRYGIRTKMDLVSKLISSGLPTRHIPRRWLLEYCHVDVDITRQVFLAMRQELTANKLWHLVHSRNLTCAVLADIEFNGLTLDPDRVAEEYSRTLQERNAAELELDEMTDGINLGSPKQLSDYIYGTLQMPEATDWKGRPIRTATGQPTANAKVLGLLKPETEEQKRFFGLYKKFNKLDSLLSKNLEFFKLVCEQLGCMFRGSINQGVTVTHRLASTGVPVLFEGAKKTRSVQFQNMPRLYKRLFWSGDDDWLIAEGDGAQLEFRVAADMGHDDLAYEEISSDADVHSVTADFLLEHKHPEFDAMSAKERRQESKQFTFKPLEYWWPQPARAVE